MSTVVGSRVDARYLLVTLMSIRLTLCGSNVCLGRNLITVFFTVNTPAKKFLPRPGRHRRRSPPPCRFHRRIHAIAERARHQRNERKALLFSCISFAHHACRKTDRHARGARGRQLPAAEGMPRGGKKKSPGRHSRGSSSVEMRKLSRRSRRRLVARHRPGDTRAHGSRRAAEPSHRRCRMRTDHPRCDRRSRDRPGAGKRKRPLARPFR